MATEILRPNAVGDETGCAQYPNTGDNYDKVDEETPDELSTYVYRSGALWGRDLYNLPASSGSGAINHITIYARAIAVDTPDQTSLVIACKSGSTADESSEITVTTSWANYSQQWSTNPDTGNAWTWSEIDDLQIGVKLRRAVAGQYKATRVTQVYVEVDYTAGATEKTSSDSGSGVDAVDSLQTPQAKTSSDTGSGVEGTPISGATLASSETGSGIEALVSRLLAAADAGYGIEASSVETDGLFKDLFATETGEGSDLLTAKIEMPTKGGGMKLWT